MCGIAGILGRSDPIDTLERVRRMTRIQAHRGPDGEGVVAVPGAVLGHRRLSIIDLSERGAQPMTSDDGRHVVTYNGEIYNYREIRRELGGPWRSDSDTEVLLAAFRRWGEDCLDRLDGMFAFCIHDTVTQESFLARDRFGQKLLVMAERHGEVLFASEIKALLAAGMPARPNMAVWGRYLAAASFDDDGDTFFADISQLQPGECAWVRPGRGIERRRWYDVSRRIAPRTKVTAQSAAVELRDLVADAARIHMRSDVPVGVSLSGGLDSSALLACLQLADSLHPSVHCYSVDFGADYSEKSWVDAAAAHHGLSAETRTFTPEAFHATLPAMMWHLEGPVGGLMNSGLSEVMAAARRDGVVVLQDGTGADEAFAGYRNMHDLHLGLLLERRAPEAETALAEYAANWGMDIDAARQSALAALGRPVTAIDGTVPVRPDLLLPRWRDPAAARNQPQGTGDRLRDRLAQWLQVAKIPRNMRMKDRLGMAYGIELRIPFLDHRVVEYGLSLPPDLWFLHGRSKSILREALKGAMDEEVRTAAKRSVHTPQGEWLRREPMRSYVRGLIESDSFAARGFFDVAAIRAAFQRFCTEGADNSFFVWQWINVEEWFRTFIDGDAVARPRPLCPEFHLPRV